MTSLILYVLIWTATQSDPKHPQVAAFQGMSQPVVESMLKARKVKYKFVTKSDYEKERAKYNH